MTETSPPNLDDILRELPRWLDGVAKFMRISKAQWTRASVGEVLLAQSLAQDTLQLKKVLMAYNQSRGIASR